METFGRYELIEQIAVGGMAEIMLARSDSLGGCDRPCVIKRIRESCSEDVHFVSLFIDEARINIGLRHDNIVRLLDFGQENGHYFMAMEYVDGIDLAVLMRHCREHQIRLPPEAAAYIAAQTLRGLEHAHTQKDQHGKPLEIVHRDVSPSNILLGIDGTVKITDFGIAAARNKLTLTSPGVVLGKSAYMSPEQALGDAVDARCDVWAMGVILHEMLSGERLFAAENDAQTLTRLFSANIQSTSALRADVDDVLDGIIARALVRERERRYLSALEMLHELEAWLSERPFSAEQLADLIDEVAWTDETITVRPPLSECGLIWEAPTTTSSAIPTVEAPSVTDPEILSLQTQLRQEPSLWTLVALADRYAVLNETPLAIAMYRCAAAVFAHKGLLIQAICAYHGARAHLAEDEIFDDFVRLGDLEPHHRQELEALIRDLEAERPWHLLLDAGGLDLERKKASSPVTPTPLFGFLAPREFAQLAEAVKIRRIGTGSKVLSEGETGDSLFAVGHGRMVVYTESVGSLDQVQDTIAEVSAKTVSAQSTVASSTGDAPITRVYLSSLTSGDFFGEFSFLTGRPRSASVEAVGESLLIEIDQAVVDSIFDVEPGFAEPLLRFYKERVIELMMAKSPVFSLLRPADRRALLEDADLEDFDDGQTILREGDPAEALYFIKRGEVEIFRSSEEGVTIFINKLAQGDFFGEIGALSGDVRTVHVRAMSDVSVFRVGREALIQVVEREPRLKKLFDRMIEHRSAETADTVQQYHKIFYEL